MEALEEDREGEKGETGADISSIKLRFTDEPEQTGGIKAFSAVEGAEEVAEGARAFGVAISVFSNRSGEGFTGGEDVVRIFFSFFRGASGASESLSLCVLRTRGGAHFLGKRSQSDSSESVRALLRGRAILGRLGF